MSSHFAGEIYLAPTNGRIKQKPPNSAIESGGVVLEITASSGRQAPIAGLYEVRRDRAVVDDVLLILVHDGFYNNDSPHYSQRTGCLSRWH
jgi:hypothetical protein